MSPCPRFPVKLPLLVAGLGASIVAVAAPTAGLHFTPALEQALRARGVGINRITLHVGAGTFLPVKVDDTEGHKMHAEWGTISASTADALGHLAGQRFDVGGHDLGGLGSSQNAWFRPEIPLAWDIAESRAIG